MRDLLGRCLRALVLLCAFVYVMREPGFVKGNETVFMVVVPVMGLLLSLVISFRSEEQAAGIIFFWFLGMGLVSLIQAFMLDQETRYWLDGMSSDAGKFISSTVDDFIANCWGLIWDFNDFNYIAFIAHCAALAWALIQLVWGMRLIIRVFVCWTWVFVCYLFDVKFAAGFYIGYRLHLRLTDMR